ncbi:MAG: substrate-binding domain-containing protein [Methylomicrobium sp.]
MKKQVPLFKITRSQIALAILFYFWIDRGYPESFPNKGNPDSVYVIVNSANPQRNISQTGLNAIFNMRLRHWSDGSPITVYVLQDEDPLHKTFCKQKLHVFPHQIRRGWNRLIFSGTGQVPMLVETKEEMLKQVSITPGAVGYLSGKDLTSAVKILEIE